MKKLLLALCAAACAHPQGATRRVEIREPTVIAAGPPKDLALDQMDDATLFDVGTRAFQAGDFEKAALHFDHVSPEASLHTAALWNAALAYERLGRNAEALARFESYLELKNEPEAQLHAALAEYRLGRRSAAAQRLHALAGRPGLSPLLRGSAMVQEAVCLIEDGERGRGEELLRSALELYDGDRKEPVDPALPAQAEFWLGETFRGAFEAQKLDPTQMDESALSAALEKKAQYLLSAQGHYLRSIRRGDGEWATASGYRIGELYEQFHDELLAAPLPKGLTESQRALYQEQLRDKVKNLVGKAIRIYEDTLETAQRVGAQSGYVEKTRQALDRLRNLFDNPRG